MASPSFVEGLEDRLLFAAAPRVTSVVADNRGEVLIQLSRTVTGVSKSSVKLFTVGANGVIGDSDDVRQPSQVVYSPSTGKITIKGKLEAGAGYRVRLQSSLISSLDGRHLDGEFTGTFPSGDGHPGGNFSFQVKNDKSSSPIVRMSTSVGIINIRMDKTDTPLSVQNFLNYANSGRYDSTFITRNIPGFIIQGGSVAVNSKNKIVETKVDAPVQNEFKAGVTTNTRGTIAFAKQGSDPNSATNQWFFNLGDNSGNLDNQNGGFTTFGTITNASGLAVMDAIAGKPVVALYNPLTGHGQGPNNLSATGLTNTPVNDTTHLTTTTEVVDPQTGEQEPVVTAGLNPSADLVIIRRIAVLDKIAPVA